jgi:hypothetical protein
MVCRERVVVGAAGRCSSAGGAASCQVMSPGLSSVVSSTLVEGALVQQTSLCVSSRVAAVLLGDGITVCASLMMS